MPRFNVNRFYELSVSAAPATPVVTAADAKAFMRVDYSTDDSYISALVTTATKWVEEYLNRALITQTLIAYYTQYAGVVYLPNAPVQSVTTVEQIAQDATATVLTAAQDYYIKGVQDKYLEFAGNTYLPSGHSVSDTLADYGLKVTYVAGYGDASTDVPEPIIEAVKRLVMYLYDNRDEVVIGAALTKMPLGLTALLDPYKNINL